MVTIPPNVLVDIFLKGVVIAPQILCLWTFMESMILEVCYVMTLASLTTWLANRFISAVKWLLQDLFNCLHWYSMSVTGLLWRNMLTCVIIIDCKLHSMVASFHRWMNLIFNMECMTEHCTAVSGNIWLAVWILNRLNLPCLLQHEKAIDYLKHSKETCSVVGMSCLFLVVSHFVCFVRTKQVLKEPSMTTRWVMMMMADQAKDQEAD